MNSEDKKKALLWIAISSALLVDTFCCGEHQVSCFRTLS